MEKVRKGRNIKTIINKNTRIPKSFLFRIFYRFFENLGMTFSVNLPENIIPSRFDLKKWRKISARFEKNIHKNAKKN